MHLLQMHMPAIFDYIINLLVCCMQAFKNENDMSETADQLKARFTTGKTVTSESMNALVNAISASSTTKETLKSYFETGDKPTQAQFYELIDAIFEQPGKLLGIQCLFMNGHNYGTASYLLEASCKRR